MRQINITQDALNIAPKIILNHKTTTEFWIYQNIDYCKAISIANKFHSYFHFEQSNAYLIAAKLYHHMGDYKNEQIFLEKAIFQDHINYEAIALMNKYSDEYKNIHIPNTIYKSYIKYETKFLEFAIVNYHPSPEIEKLDLAINLNDNHQFKKAKEIITSSPLDCHRYYLLFAKVFAQREEFENALKQVNLAINLLEKCHANYHQQSAEIYLLRANKFSQDNQYSLAKNDLLKARDLNPKITTPDHLLIYL
jgi:tetratricopeptide (TPR) repeat protein